MARPQLLVSIDSPVLEWSTSGQFSSKKAHVLSSLDNVLLVFLILLFICYSLGLNVEQLERGMYALLRETNYWQCSWSNYFWNPYMSSQWALARLAPLPLASLGGGWGRGFKTHWVRVKLTNNNNKKKSLYEWTLTTSPFSSLNFIEFLSHLNFRW